MSADDLETPILCEPCLGPNPYIRMTKDPQGKVCKICTRPFTVFRWNPGAGSRFKKTEICATCAKVKNVCQTCILDLQYGLTVQVRDAALGLKSGGQHSSDKTRAYAADVAEKQLEGSDGGMGTLGRAGQELVRKAARKEIEYKRDRSQQLCSAFARGRCERGDACPFKHELPADMSLVGSPAAGPSSGAQAPSPVAPRITKPAAGLPPPQDTSIVSLFISSLPPSTTEPALRQFFLDLTPQLQPDHIKSVTLVATSRCAFVNFRTRQQAEWAAKQCEPKMLMGEQEVRLTWGRSRPKKQAGKE
ncbi:RNA recognition motif domain protein [Kalmanozyma brasiliensis GHG001]|uniref:Cell cycle control protein cwf5 n=1 Tax=Kalmanozyma brasiliensis (strain GHG001) TaxID=1365824 RepID=V5EWD6_KALBG|nr:RNA recognition motif domain protein [Kalmanozyma brasiliensis GHG001]EST06599.1 RNA recognition motif domain protein [Kalmanozyma brasiliensis GHG001]